MGVPLFSPLFFLYFFIFCPQSITYVATGFSFDGCNKLTLAKMEEPLNIRWSRTIPKKAKATSVTVTRDTTNHYFISILCDDEVAQLEPSDKQIGIGMGLNHFLIRISIHACTSLSFASGISPSSNSPVPIAIDAF